MPGAVVDRVGGRMRMRKYGARTTQIRAKVGEHFAIELPAHPTAGYVWQLTQAAQVAELKGEAVRPAGAARGAASIQAFEFAATRAGTGALVIVCKRPWEMTAGKRLEVTIVVEP